MSQVILLTGASSGIGYNTAKDLAAAVRRPKAGRQRDSISLQPRLWSTNRSLYLPYCREMVAGCGTDPG